ncbi:hypothetical protein TNIN_186951 [Trichonephila inaurata madagascariensis]|uniref:Uncharacterized protein n=1 Tax=Trichonephila inaurata madagascariensis TaxID=2747483 RepID=A0A8X6Y973_9ARAC|nr:hypothetical protein TNIN_186951 [Trichonephila inaurata madagascariensis]
MPFSFPRSTLSIRCEDNASNQRRGLLSFQDDALLRFVRDVFFKGGHPLCGSLGWQSGDDHRHRPSFRPPTGRLGQQQPPHRECGRVWHVHGHHSRGCPLRCQRKDENCELRDRIHCPSQDDGVGEGALRLEAPSLLSTMASSLIWLRLSGGICFGMAYFC